MSVLIIPFLYYITSYLYIYLSSFLYASNLFLIIMLTSIIMLHVGPAPLLYPLCIISSPAEEKACVVIFAGLTPPPSASPTSAPRMLPTFLVSEWVFDGKADPAQCTFDERVHHQRQLQMRPVFSALSMFPRW